MKRRASLAVIAAVVRSRRIAQAQTHQLVRVAGASNDVIAKMNRATDPEYLDPRYIQPIIDVLAKYHALSHGFPAPDVSSSAAFKPA